MSFFKSGWLFLHTVLSNMKDFKQTDMTHRWDPKDMTTPSQSEPRSNGDEGVLLIHQISRTKASSSDVI